MIPNQGQWFEYLTSKELLDYVLLSNFNFFYLAKPYFYLVNQGNYIAFEQKYWSNFT